MPHKHAEAFRLMEYTCEKCGKVEILWNSRDGVTPFFIGCATCQGSMKHTNWNKDVYNPEFYPTIGMRVFIDSTPEISAVQAKAMVEKFWNHEKLPMKKSFPTKQEAFECMLENFKDGAPFILVVGE